MSKILNESRQKLKNLIICQHGATRMISKHGFGQA